VGLSLTEKRRQIFAIAERVASGHGVEVFDVQLRRESIGWVLRVVLDRQDSGVDDDSISVDDCQKVSQDLNAVLDVEDALDHAYILEVSSPGLDRPLRTPGEYQRFVGRLAQIVVSEAINGQTFLKGRIQEVTDGTVLLESNSRLHRVPFEIISRAKLEVEF
jgi:ribosome maturation factor RimP|tara:strand:+ start:33112 stop:33597 length:486 start_codon:yes stop_codon:yes gene_type:complete